MATRENVIFASATRAQADSPFISSVQENVALRPSNDVVEGAGNGLRYRGVRLYLDITAISNTPTLDIKMQGKDPASGKWFDTPGVVFAQKTGTGQDILAVYPSVAVSANQAVSDVLPDEWRLHATVGDAGGDDITFSVGAEWLL